MVCVESRSRVWANLLGYISLFHAEEDCKVRFSSRRCPFLYFHFSAEKNNLNKLGSGIFICHGEKEISICFGGRGNRTRIAGLVGGKMTNYADDNFIKESNENLEQLIEDMKKTLEAIIKWLKKLGLNVNDGKTEICLFHRQDQHRIAITTHNEIIHSKPNINILGVTFDSKLNWTDHMSNAISKTHKALHCIKK